MYFSFLLSEDFYVLQTMNLQIKYNIIIKN